MSVRINQRWPEGLKASLDSAAKHLGKSATEITVEAVSEKLGYHPSMVEVMVGAQDDENEKMAEQVAKRPERPPLVSPKPTGCPDHPGAGRIKQHGKTYCDAPLCQFTY